MKNKLKLKHLAPYLPYKLKINTGNLEREMICCEIHNKNHTSINNIISGVGHKPILRPLSELVISEENFGEYYSFYPEEFKQLVLNGNIEHRHMEYLFKNHFDVFGLREKKSLRLL